MVKLRRAVLHRGHGWQSATVSLRVETEGGPVVVIGHGRDPDDAEIRAREEAAKLLGAEPR